MTTWSVIRSSRIGLLFARAAVLLALLCVSNITAAQESDYGKPGEPVNLVVGYQPYGTENLDGIVMREKELWTKYLPKGSTVEMQIALQGSIIVNNMLAGKAAIGFMGDMPSITSTTKRQADLRIVAVNSIDPMCQYLVVRADAPDFKTREDAFKWLNGKTVAAPKGSCADRFMNVVLSKENIKPAAYLNQGNEVIISNFRAKRLDGAVTWEPYIGKMVAEHLARIVANGEPYNENNVTFVVMRADLIKQRPDVVKAWLNAELDAQLFLSDPKNAKEIVAMFVKANPGFSPEVFWNTLYGTYPIDASRSKVRLTFAFAVIPQVMDVITKDVSFLKSIKAIDVDKLRPDAIMPQFTEEILKERGLKAPVGVVNAMPSGEK